MVHFLKRRSLALLLCITLCSAPTMGQTTALHGTDVRESLYQVVAKGFNVGEVKTVFTPEVRNNRRYIRFGSTTRVKARFFFASYTLDNREDALVGDEGTVSYRRVATENGGRRQVVGSLENGNFHLDLQENGVNRSVDIRREQYDFTTMDLPELTLKNQGDEASLRVLDLENAAVVVRTYRWVASEDMLVDGRKVRCEVIEYRDPNKSGRRWIRKDDLGVTIARQDAKGKHGSYSLRMTGLSVHSPSSPMVNKGQALRPEG